MDFSGRPTSLYVSLGRDRRARRRTLDDGGTTAFERFLGTRLHGFTTIVRVERGSGFIVTPTGRVSIAAGDTAVIPPGSIGYAFGGERRVDIFATALHVDAGMIVKTADVPADLFELAERDVIATLRAAPAIAHLVRSPYERAALRALQRIDAEPANARLTVVAHALGYSADGLAALLARSTGAGFAAWRDALVMAHVRDALTTPKPVVQIARELDLESNYLHRRFARSHGTTPAKWRGAPAPPERALAHGWDSVLRYFA